MCSGEHSTRNEGVVLRSLAQSGVMILVVLSCCHAYADVVQPINGSFELDGPIPDLSKRSPTGWTAAVAVPRFGGMVDAASATDGRFSLVLYVQRYVSLAAGDMATVSQSFDLTDVNEIACDVMLDTYMDTQWDPNLCSAVVMIDEEVVWDTNDLAAGAIGVPQRQAYQVEDKYRDGLPHNLTLALRANADSQWGLSDFYRVRWDNVRCTSFGCEGGLQPGDFNRDCFMDMNDMVLMAAMWLDEVASWSPYNLSGIDDEESLGVVNFYDFAVFGGSWRAGNFPQQEMIGP